MNNEELLKIIRWATGDDTGLSSTALCRFMLGLPSIRNYPPPSDADDRGRCIRLLNLVPEWWDRLDEMAKLPSRRVHYFGSNGGGVRTEGWEEQIPLIKKEGGRTSQNEETPT
jgi:hypothetical protein